jgi:hypothetical protein
MRVPDDVAVQFVRKRQVPAGWITRHLPDLHSGSELHELAHVQYRGQFAVHLMQLRLLPRQHPRSGHGVQRLRSDRPLRDPERVHVGEHFALFSMRDGILPDAGRFGVRSLH